MHTRGTKFRNICRTLLRWYDASARDLPWRRETDPYRTWISEVMLQQTRVATVIPYFERFLERFPTIEALAAARDEDLLAAWSGLGYYSRARNLKKAASAMNGSFPGTYEDIRSLPGVGDYTAAAVASIAFGLPHAALDGNVLRVLARLVNDGGDIGDVSTRKRLADVADALLDPRRPGDFNQALMELGATVCVPRHPRCLMCPVEADCEGRRAGRQDELPIKLRRVETVRLERTVCVVRRGPDILMRRRADSEKRLAGFWELLETGDMPGASVVRRLGAFRHSITNHDFRFEVVLATITRKPAGSVWVRLEETPRLPLTTVARKALRFIHEGHGQNR